MSWIKYFIMYYLYNVAYIDLRTFLFQLLRKNTEKVNLNYVVFVSPEKAIYRYYFGRRRRRRPCPRPRRPAFIVWSVTLSS